VWDAGIFEALNGSLSVGVIVIKARNGNRHIDVLRYFAALTLPWKSTLTLVDEPPLSALPRHTPLSSFLRLLTLVKPAPSIFDLAWPSVKLLRPATGALELFCPELFTALLPGPDCAGGSCAKAGVVAAKRDAVMIKAKRFFEFPPEGQNGRNPSTRLMFLPAANGIDVDHLERTLLTAAGSPVPSTLRDRSRLARD
jgi:hypothetical protein